MKKIHVFMLMLAYLIICECASAADIPYATDIRWEGVNIVGRTLEGNYTYMCNDTIEEKGTAFRWLRSETYDGDYSPISGAVQNTYVTTSQDTDKYIKFEVTPKNSSASGNPVLSEAFRIKAESYPEAFNVTINGSGKCDEELYADYHYRDENEEPQMNVYYQWEVSKYQAFAYSSISGATSQSFIPTEEHCGKWIRVQVKVDKLGDGSYPSAGYTSSSPMLIKSKPAADNVTAVKTETLLTGKYTYSDNAGIMEGDSFLAWEMSKEADGVYTAFSYGEQIALPYVGEECYVRFAVTPVNNDGISGDKVCSEPVYLAPNAVSTGYMTQAVINSGETLKIKLFVPEVYSAVTAEIHTDTTNLLIESDSFDCVLKGKDGKYICVFTPKNVLSVCSENMDVEISSESQASIRIENVTILSGDDTKIAAAGFDGINGISCGVLTLDASGKKFSRTVSYSKDSETHVKMIVAAYDLNGALIDCDMESYRFTHPGEHTFDVELIENSAESIEVFLWNGDVLIPYVGASLVEGD